MRGRGEDGGRERERRSRGGGRPPRPRHRRLPSSIGVPPVPGSVCLPNADITCTTRETAGPKHRPRLPRPPSTPTPAPSPSPSSSSSCLRWSSGEATSRTRRARLRPPPRPSPLTTPTGPKRQTSPSTTCRQTSPARARLQRRLRFRLKPGLHTVIRRRLSQAVQVCRHLCNRYQRQGTHRSTMPPFARINPLPDYPLQTGHRAWCTASQ